ncbi:MAG: class I SAM-dependent methyltransferase [Burkholderiales bacterium]|nr:class I SAM-dependent methyltransferase [Burkholderiales bacterium]
MVQNNWNANLYDSKHNFVTNYGNNVIDLLNPLSHETILDLGCGSGELTAKMNDLSTKAVGIDFSENMISQAKARFNDVEFYQHNAELPFPFDYQFDAVFSNAALHWMHNADAVISNVANSLKNGGRFVFEMGGIGNINTIIQAIDFAAQQFGLNKLPLYNYFPSIPEYSNIIEKNNIQVIYAQLFERPTPLDGEEGLRNWIKMFRNNVLEQINPENHEEFFKLVEEYARPKLYINGKWSADYVRLRMIAIKA